MGEASRNSMYHFGNYGNLCVLLPEEHPDRHFADCTIPGCSGGCACTIFLETKHFNQYCCRYDGLHDIIITYLGGFTMDFQEVLKHVSE